MSKNICRMTLLLFLCGLIFMFTDAPVSFSAEEVSVAFSSNRTSFLRMEENINLNVSVKNQGILPLSGMSLQVEMGGGKAIIPIPFANSGSLKYKLDTTVPAGTYDLTARVVDASGKAYSNEGKFTVVIVKRPLPSRMSLTMWGGGDSTFGFTHTAIFDTHWHSRPYFTSEVWANRKPVAGANQQHEVSAGFYTPDKIYDRLNDGLVNGMGYYVQTTPMRWIGEAKKEFNRIDRSGKPYAYENTCCLMPGLEEYCYNVGASVAQTYGEFPALQAALIHSEVRDSTQLCFHEEDKAAFKKFSGFDIPDAAVTASGVRGLPGLPSDRIIPDDNPILTYYKWFWKEGDGWNRIHTATSKGLKSTGRSDLWTFFDPAVRAPSIYGSGGEVDIVSSWYYTYPDPINIGMMTDELFALARGSANPNQKVMAMTQIIWYRSGVAPIGRTGKDGYKAEWEAREPEAAFITIAPDHLKIAFWSKIARPVQGIMYHGWGSLVAGEQGGYRYTNPETQNTLRTLVKEVLQPLGPTLMQVPERKTDVAFLESFTSQMLAGRGTHGGGGGWGGDSYLVLLYAQLQPEIVYEEEIAKKGLDKYKVLVMTDCDYLPRSVADKVLQFQGRGGIIIGDERLAPAISPDIIMQSYPRTQKADADKAALKKMSAELRGQLEPYYDRPFDSSNDDVVVRLRKYGTTDYVFAVNDNRKFGKYVGQYGLVMEEGVPSQAVVSVRREKGYIYDLVAGKEVAGAGDKNWLRINKDFGAAEGSLWMVTEKQIKEVKIDLPAKAKRGGSFKIGITVADSQGKAIDAVVPVNVEITNASGAIMEYSGYYGAKDGVLNIKYDASLKDEPGTWRIKVKELASGKTGEGRISLQ